MEFQRTGQFRRAYRRLSRQDQNRVEAVLIRFAENPLHPGLNVEKITGNIWSFRVSRRVRCTFEWEGSMEGLLRAEIILLRNVGGHEVYR
jgi:hypothetical protein